MGGDEPRLSPTAVPSEKTFSEKLGHALELSAQIKDILNISLPTETAGKPVASKVEVAHEGMERLISNLIDIKREVVKI